MSGTEAGIKHAQEVIKEAEIGLGYTEIKAPESGEVLKRLVEPGNLALPGKPLVILQITGSLRLEAYVREGLIRKVKPGAELQVAITTLNETANAKVEEIIPYADPQTRTFLVKVSLPHITGLYPGMFGKLLIPVQEHQVVAIPGKAVRNVGQLELVSIREKNTWKTRFVKTGKKIGDKVEVLSGTWQISGSAWQTKTCEDSRAMPLYCD
ncbi:MAG: HlyD family efflux transporter periplasmic adaptor subunit [Desulfobacterales bacterium]|nr:HlyD family efflux transporter periplasmic adaptor subunit [Desulfobacterales bacterium]